VSGEFGVFGKCSWIRQILTIKIFAITNFHDTVAFSAYQALHSHGWWPGLFIIVSSFVATAIGSWEFPTYHTPQSCLHTVLLQLGIHLHREIFTGLPGCP